MAIETVKLSVDTVAFSVHDGSLEVLLLKRKYDPFKSHWALPGGFMQAADQTPEIAAHRELEEGTNVRNIYLEQLYTFGDRKRDPRGRVVTVAYLALLRRNDVELRASSRASGLAWWPVNDLPELAFDHGEIINYAHQRLKDKIEYSAAAFKLLPPKFTLRDLQTIYEAVLVHPVDNRNFRKKFLSCGILKELDEKTREGSFRPARLYAFSETDFEKLPDRPVFVF